MADTAEKDKTHPASTFKHDEDFSVQVATPAHPVTKGIDDFQIKDETYNGFIVEDHVTELLRTDHPTSGPVIGWAHQYGESRVVYIQLGHGPPAYQDPNYRKLVSNAIRWTARRK